MMPVLDLDELIEEPVKFRLLGIDRIIKPLTSENFFKVTNAFSKIQNSESKTPKLLAAEYFDIFNSCVEPITMSDVNGMTQAQIAALIIMIVRRIQGESVESLSDIEEKKKIINQPQ